MSRGVVLQIPIFHYLRDTTNTFKMLRFITVIFIIISAATSIRAQKKDIEVTFERDRNNKGAYIFYCESQLEGKTKVTVDFKILDNLRIVGGHNPYITTVSKGKRRLFRLKPRMENRGTNFRYTTSWIPGCSKTKVKKDITYLIPFLPNKEITTTGVHYLGKEFNQEAP